MAAKGSRKNPYTLSEYNGIGSDSWTGGWVQESENYVIYRNRFKTVTYTGFCTKGNPVPGDLYNEMTQNHIWLGGWVLFGTLKKYVDSNDDEYNSTLGTQSDPCSMVIYNEMISNGIWEGGWVQASNGQAHYMQNYNLILDFGSGCGCGCGCGCGYGSGYGSGAYSGSCPAYGSGSGSGELSSEGFPICAGNYKVGGIVDRSQNNNNNNNNGNNYNSVGELHISWTEGNTQGQNDLSEVTVSAKMTNYRYCVLQNNLYTTWVAPYEVAIHGTIVFQRDSEQLEYSIDGRYTITMEYYQI